MPNDTEPASRLPDELEREAFRQGYLAALEDIQRDERLLGTMGMFGVLSHRLGMPHIARAAADNALDRRRAP